MPYSDLDRSEDMVEARQGPRSLASSFVLVALPSVLFVATFFRPIFQDENFVYRDAGHFYYPYFKVQVDQWRDGKVPLWNPYENGGEPLAANPTASVFYPLKLLFLLPYHLAYKWYLMGHLALAGLTCFLAARGLGASTAGALLTAIAYSFSGFVFFQLYNVVFLVGAAWLPLGLLATDRLVRSPTLAWSVLLSIVLALQVLGGDPQTAQLTGVFAIGYALLFHLGLRFGILILAALLGLGAGIVHCLPWLLAEFKSFVIPILDLGNTTASNGLDEWRRRNSMPLAISGASCLCGLVALCFFRRRWLARPFSPSLVLLTVSAALAFGLAAIQVLPTMEFASRTGRASPDVPEETAAFSLHPARLAEFLLPAAYGRMFPTNTRWFPFARWERSIWVPTLYMGLLPFVFAISAATRSRLGDRRTWLVCLALVSLWMAFGKFGGVAWLWNPDQFGAKDPLTVERGSRLHGDNDGLYWLAENTIPGFAQFRYPSKLLVFTVCAIALLAGMGLDDLLAHCKDGRIRRFYLVLMIVGNSLGLVYWIATSSSVDWLKNLGRDSTTYGPFMADLAWIELFLSCAHFGIVSSLAFILLLPTGRLSIPSNLLGVLLVAITAGDLAIADRWLVITDKQSAIDEPPTVLAAIAKDAAAKGFTDPYRIHRTRIFDPPRFAKKPSPDRVIDGIRWERNTAQPKYAITAGFSYAKTEGTMTLYDIDFFFAPWTVPTPPPLRAQALQTPDQMVYFPKNGFDLWNSRYFILPRLVVLDHVDRGSFTLLFDRTGKPLPVVAESPSDEDDYLVVENTEALPRAWIVREVEPLPEIHNMLRADRAERMERLLYRSRDAGLPLWQGRPHGDYDFRHRAMIDAELSDAKDWMVRFGSESSPTGEDKIHFEAYKSDVVRLRVNATSAGLLVLADTYYPGWRAYVDGQPTIIRRANLAMRGVLVPAGNHLVEFRFQSRSVLLGAAITAFTFAGLLIGFVARPIASCLERTKIRPPSV